MGDGGVHELAFGPFRLDRTNARLLRDGQAVSISPKAFDLLHHLASRPDQLVTKRDLLQAVWADVIVSDASLKVCIGEVRKALGDEVKSPRYIETVHRRGYRFLPQSNASRSVATEDASEPAAQPPRPAPQECDLPPRHTLVGREREIQQLRDRFRRTLAGERQCIFIAGSPGCGKTALVETFTRELQASAADATAPAILIGHCFEQFGTNEPYLPLWEAIARAARNEPDSPLRGLLDRYTAAHRSEEPDSATSSSTPAREPRGQSERLLREMADALEALAAQTPVLLLLEDVHWIDFSTLDLLRALARRRSAARLMVLATYRPAAILTADHPLRAAVQDLLAGGLADELTLDFLNRAAVAAYLASRFPGAALPAVFAERLHQRTDGHPLFLVHLVNQLIEQEVLREQDGSWAMAGAGSSPAGMQWPQLLETQIPRTVRAMIEANLDRLDPAQRLLLEAAAAAGVEFSAAAAAAALTGAGAAPAPPDAVENTEHTCEELARRYHLLQACGADEWPDGTLAARYRFVHELYHNFVYEQIPIARRIRLHLAVGLRLETAWGAKASEEAAGLAMHFEKGRDWPRAVKYLRQAAQAAVRQYAHREAVGYLRRAATALERLSAADRAEVELDVLMSLGVNLQVTEGFAAPEVQAILARASALCRANSGAAEPAAGTRSPAVLRHTFSVLWGIWVFHKVRSDLRQATELAEQLLKMAHDAGDPPLMLQAHQAMCMTALCLGDFERSREQMEQAAKIYSPDHCAENISAFGQDPGVATLAFGAVALCILGRDAEALAAIGRAITFAEQLHQPSSLAVATHFAAMLHQLRDEPTQAERYAQANIELATAEGFSFWRAGGTVLRGWAKARQHGAADPAAAEAAIAEIRQGLSAWLATGSRTYHTYFLGLLADALQHVGRVEASLAPIDEALSHVQTLPEGLYEAELHRLKGRCLLALEEPDARERARASLEKAARVAVNQHATLFESRARWSRVPSVPSTAEGVAGREA